MNTKRIILASVIIWLVSTAFTWLTCGWLFTWVYEIPPMIWLPPEEMMSTNSLVLSNIFGIVISFIFTLVYAVLYKGIPGKGFKKGMIYGILLWLVGALSGLITMPFYMTIATAVISYWIISSLALNLINGAILGAIYKTK